MPGPSRRRGIRTDLHVHWMGRNDEGDDLGYAAFTVHPDGERKSYCMKCVLEAKEEALRRR